MASEDELAVGREASGEKPVGGQASGEKKVLKATQDRAQAAAIQALQSAGIEAMKQWQRTRQASLLDGMPRVRAGRSTPTSIDRSSCLGALQHQSVVRNWPV